MMIKFKIIPSVLTMVLAVLPLTGCGYTNQTVLPRNIRTVYVDTVKNKVPVHEVYAYVPGLEMDITNAIIRRLQVDGNLEVVERDEADAVWKPIF